MYPHKFLRWGGRLGLEEFSRPSESALMPISKAPANAGKAHVRLNPGSQTQGPDPFADRVKGHVPEHLMGLADFGQQR